MRLFRTAAVTTFLLLLMGPFGSVGRTQQTGPLDPQTGLDALVAAEGVEVTLFASEPMVRNPAVMDIDSRGRVWAAEGINYRQWRDLQPEGDKIVILEDTDLDGKADKTTIYYQGPEIDNALGLCVLGNKVIVSRSPDVFIFTDEDGDDKPDKKERLFVDFSGEQHDHGVHSFVFGPDGKLYFNMGNEGRQPHDSEGKPIVDMAGNLVEDEVYPYREGMIFRCNLDGSEFETLAWNFRNNYEVAVDSFGTMWQSDNDDDGNRGVRINYVMEYGNYGYRDEMTGGNWRDERPNWEKEIPNRHWHRNDPGVVPNLLQTGAGSPTGMIVYEGDLLPEVFHNQMIHCDAGPNIVRSYPVKADGAGYEAEIVDLVHGGTDKWFRPADVCAAPDGSVYIADWYDPGVGGHAMGDHDTANIRGRIFRVAPKGHTPNVPEVDCASPEGAALALRSPNVATRYLAWSALREMGAEGEAALLGLWNDPNPRMRARALHLLARIEGLERKYLDLAVGDENSDIRIAALRIARERKIDLDPFLERLVKNSSAQVRRECALALRHHSSQAAPDFWAELALAYDGKDRWYLEALGIGADRQDTDFLTAWLNRVGDDWNTPEGADILWRSRSPITSQFLVALIGDKNNNAEACARYLRAFHFQPEDGRSRALWNLFNIARVSAVGSEKWTRIATDLLCLVPEFQPDPDRIPSDFVDHLADHSKGTPRFLQLVEKFDLAGREDDLLELAIATDRQETGVRAVHRLLARDVKSLLSKAVLEGASPEASRVADLLGYVGSDGARDILLAALRNADLDPSVHKACVSALVRNQVGADALLDLAKEEGIPPSAKGLASVRLNNVHSSWSLVKEEAAKILPLPVTSDGGQIPPLNKLLEIEARAEGGRAVYERVCLECHKIAGEGTDFGPELTDIGNKFGKDGLYEAITDPSAGISFGYESHRVEIDSGTDALGYVVRETEEEIVLKEAGGIEKQYYKDEILRHDLLKTSLMSEGLTQGMTRQEFADLLEYLSGLKVEN